MKTALITDYMLQVRGAERTFLSLLNIFINCDVYTLLHDSQHFPILNKTIHTSFLQTLPFIYKYYRNLFLLYPFAIETLDLSKYDIVISNSSLWAHGVLVHPEAYHICYCHTPNRYLWHYFPKLLGSVENRISPTKMWRSIIANYVRLWDYQAAQRADCFVASSQNAQKRIAKYYRKTSEIIYPGIELAAFPISNEDENYYLVVAELLDYKRVDIVVEAFKKNSQKLAIVGVGPNLKKLQALANSAQNIRFYGHLSKDKLIELYQRCRAVIVPGLEDFGLVSVEGQACGKPVIAYRGGGNIETVTPNVSGIFFNEQSSESLLGALNEFNKEDFSPQLIRNSVLRFDVGVFNENWKRLLNEKGLPTSIATQM